MSHEFLPLAAAAAHVHIAANDLKHVAQRGEIDAQIRSGEWYFEHAALDEWAQRHLLASTRKELDEVLDGEAADDDARTPSDVYRDAGSVRAATGAAALAVAVAGWSAIEAVRQVAPRRGAVKTWEVNSGNPRASHAAMNGETVPYSEPFSNGAMWPGDSSVLDAAEVANCQCSVLITIP